MVSSIDRVRIRVAGAYMRVRGSREQGEYMFRVCLASAAVACVLVALLGWVLSLKPLLVAGVMVYMPLLAFLPVLITVLKDGRRTAAIDAALPDTLYKVASSTLVTGMGLHGAVGEVAKTAPEPLATELKGVYKSTRMLRKGLGPALVAMAKRNDSAHLTRACAVVSTALKTGEQGINLALNACGDMVRTSKTMAEERKTAVSGATQNVILTQLIMMPLILGGVVSLVGGMLGSGTAATTVGSSAVALVGKVLTIYFLLQAIIVAWGIGLALNRSAKTALMLFLLGMTMWLISYVLFFSAYI